MIDSPVAQFAQLFQTLREDFARRAPAKISALREAIEAVVEGPDERARWTLVHHLAHSLAGAAPTFGMVAVGSSAREVEVLAARFLDCGGSEGETLAELVAIGRKLGPEPLSSEVEPLLLAPRSTLPSAVVREALVYIVDKEREFAREIALQVEHFGFEARVFHTLEDASAAASSDPPSAIILDMDFPGVGSGEDPLAPLTVAGIPVLHVSSTDDLATRLTAVRSGGRAFLKKPVSPGVLIDKLDKVLSPPEANPYRVLVVDDDGLVARAHAAMLRSGGMVTSTLTDPMGARERIAEFAPDVILTDLHMPGCDGFELAAALRQDDMLLGVPIVFLSSEREIERQMQAITLGADDFLEKPVARSLLVVTIAARAERARALRAMMDRDPLTRLLNHSRVEDAVQREFLRATDSGAPLSFVMIDVDRFKSVNDQYGHLAGDACLRDLAVLLRRRLRPADLVGRWGGEEFAVVMPETDSARAASVIDEIRTSFAGLAHDFHGREFSVTFSAGVASYPFCSTPMSLVETADQLLASAKQGGRNRVITETDLTSG